MLSPPFPIPLLETTAASQFDRPHILHTPRQGDTQNESDDSLVPNLTWWKKVREIAKFPQGGGSALWRLIISPSANSTKTLIFQLLLHTHMQLLRAKSLKHSSESGQRTFFGDLPALSVFPAATYLLHRANHRIYSDLGQFSFAISESTYCRRWNNL